MAGMRRGVKYTVWAGVVSVGLLLLLCLPLVVMVSMAGRAYEYAANTYASTEQPEDGEPLLKRDSFTYEICGGLYSVTCEPGDTEHVLFCGNFMGICICAYLVDRPQRVKIYGCRLPGVAGEEPAADVLKAD